MFSALTLLLVYHPSDLVYCMWQPAWPNQLNTRGWFEAVRARWMGIVQVVKLRFSRDKETETIIPSTFAAFAV